MFLEVSTKVPKTKYIKKIILNTDQIIKISANEGFETKYTEVKLSDGSMFTLTPYSYVTLITYLKIEK